MSTETISQITFEGQVEGDTAGVVAVADDLDHPRDTVTYDLVDDAGGLFAIDGETGVVTLSGEAEYEPLQPRNHCTCCKQ